MCGNTTGHNEYDIQQNITEQTKDKDIRKEDLPLITEYTHEDFDHFVYPFVDIDTWCYDKQNSCVGLTGTYFLYKTIEDLRLQIFSLHDEIITFYLEPSAHMIEEWKTYTCP